MATTPTFKFSARGDFTDGNGALSEEARESFEALNRELQGVPVEGAYPTNAVLFGDVNGALQSISLNTHKIIVGDANGVPVSLSFGQNRFFGTLASGGLITMTKLQVTNQLNLTAMVGKSQGVAVTDATASTVSVTSADATDLPSVITLSNEMKGDVNQLVSDVNDAIEQLNLLITSLEGGALIAT